MHTMKGHASRITSVAVSSDGCFAFSGSNDRTAKLWDLRTGRLVRDFVRHKLAITCVIVSPDGQWALTGSADGTLCQWELSSGRCRRVLEGHVSGVTCVAVTPDGRWVLSGSSDNTLRWWDISSGSCVHVNDSLNSRPTCMAISGDGCRAAIGCRDASLELWDIDWDLEFPGWSDWSESARPYLRNFLTLCGAQMLPGTANRRLEWTRGEFENLICQLQYAGYGWIRPEGIKNELELMARKWWVD